MSAREVTAAARPWTPTSSAPASESLVADECPATRRRTRYQKADRRAPTRSTPPRVTPARRPRKQRHRRPTCDPHPRRPRALPLAYSDCTSLARGVSRNAHDRSTRTASLHAVRRSSARRSNQPRVTPDHEMPHEAHSLHDLSRSRRAGRARVSAPKSSREWRRGSLACTPPRYPQQRHCEGACEPRASAPTSLVPRARQPRALVFSPTPRRRLADASPTPRRRRARLTSPRATCRRHRHPRSRRRSHCLCHPPR
jgi:hypothetical protein